MVVTITWEGTSPCGAARSGGGTGQAWMGGTGSVAVGFLGVDPGRVLLQRLRAPRKRLLHRLPAAGAEHVALPDPVKPLLQLVQVDLVLLQFRERVVAGHVLLLHLRKEVLTAVHDLLVLVVPGRL